MHVPPDGVPVPKEVEPLERRLHECPKPLEQATAADPHLLGEPVRVRGVRPPHAGLLEG